MVPAVLPSRQHKNVRKPFNELVSYIECAISLDQFNEVSGSFQNIVDYMASSVDTATSEDKCVAVRLHGVGSLSTAALEMNAVSRQNKRCDSPSYHFILSWPEFERPSHDLVFDAAEHAINALGLSSHQYIIGIHVNTDNLHCHIGVNRINPVTFKAHHIAWDHKTLHFAARESEIKHNWTHDNGIYIVDVDNLGRKEIVFNPFALRQKGWAPHAHAETAEHLTLPPWHDPSSLEAWLKVEVAADLKRNLPQLQSWHALHVWLSKYDITMTDSGGGFRLHARSPDNEEQVVIAASKGLRLLKRSELEARWGKFKKPIDISVISPDLSHLNPDQLRLAVTDFFDRSFDKGVPPYDFLRAQDLALRDRAARIGRRREMFTVGSDLTEGDVEVARSDAASDEVGNMQTTQDAEIHRMESPTAGVGGSDHRQPLGRDSSKRDERREQRAQARAELRSRFSRYKLLVAVEDSREDGYLAQEKNLRVRRTAFLREIRQAATAARVVARKTMQGPELLKFVVQIHVLELQRKQDVLSAHSSQHQALNANRVQPLGWREWLYEQAKLGDQAALSRLRGIVYQGHRDAVRRRKEGTEPDPEQQIGWGAGAADPQSVAYRQEQYGRAISQLLEQEKQETAIRAARSNMMRPYQVDATLTKYIAMSWEVSGNGNVSYRDAGGKLIFTDRGSRVTFDRVLVTDEEIRLALVHARAKFGDEIILTSSDSVFMHRMAFVADDLGMVVLNPELQAGIGERRATRVIEIDLARASGPTSTAAAMLQIPAEVSQVRNLKTSRWRTEWAERTQATESSPVQKGRVPPTPRPVDILGAQSDQMHELFVDNLESATARTLVREDRLKEMVLAIDPYAQFVVPDVSTANAQFEGRVVASLVEGGFVNHIGRGVYAVHWIHAPSDHGDRPVRVRYVAGEGVATLEPLGKGKEIDR